MRKTMGPSPLRRSLTGGGASPWAEPHLPADTGLLQQEVLDARAHDHAAGVEVDVDVLSEAARVIVVDRLGVSEG